MTVTFTSYFKYAMVIEIFLCLSRTPRDNSEKVFAARLRLSPSLRGQPSRLWLRMRQAGDDRQPRRRQSCQVDGDGADAGRRPAGDRCLPAGSVARPLPVIFMRGPYGKGTGKGFQPARRPDGYVVVSRTCEGVRIGGK